MRQDHAVLSWAFDALHDRYVRDEDLRRRFVDNNPFALARMMATLRERANRGYWDALTERLEELTTCALELEGGLGRPHLSRVGSAQADRRECGAALLDRTFRVYRE